MNKLLALAGICALSSPALASVVWDENVDGNLSNDPFSPTVLDFNAGSNMVIGRTLGSSTAPSDGYDVFSFVIEAGETLESIFLDAYLPASGGSSGFNFTSGAAAGAGGTFIFGPAADGTFVGTDFLVTQGVGSLGAGTYFMEVREFGGPLAEWQLNFNVTPSPSSAALLGLGGLVATRRRR